MSYEPWMGNLVVGSTLGNYGTVKFLLDEEHADSALSVRVRVEIAAGEFSPGDFEVEVFTNLNRRDFVKAYEPLAEALNPASSYWLSTPMQYVGKSYANFVYEVTLPIQKCGAYRLTTRYRRTDSSEFYWHNQFSPGFGAAQHRDCAIVVSPTKAARLRIYEANALTVEATRGGDYDNRSTFDDFLPSHDFDGFNPFQLDYVTRTLGFNTLWLMPIFPNTRWRWDVPRWQWAENDSPGSPYAARDYYSVNPWLADTGGAQRAFDLFKEIIDRGHEGGLDVFIDVAFNHAGRDVVYGAGGVELGICAPSEADSWIREVRPSFCTRGSEFRWDGIVPHYRERADSGFACAVWAPTDRLNEHVWDDGNVDWYFGDYSTLGPKPGVYYDPRGNAEDERDLYYSDLGADQETAALWRYFAHILPFWLGRTDNKLAGIRADFAQGLPNQLWEFIINTTRKSRWDFVFLAEVLDPDVIQYRLNRVFDVLSSKDHYLYRSSDVRMSQLFGSLEAEANVLGGGALLMHNGTSHDEQGNPDKWAMVARYAVAASLYGTPMVFMGQPLGLADKLPFRNSFANMYDAWTSEDPERAPVAEMYRRINTVRESSIELREKNRYFLQQLQGGFRENIFSLARWVPAGDVDSVVLVFVNLSTTQPGGAVFAIPRSVRLTGNYQARNLAAIDPDRDLWPVARSAEDIYRFGVYVAFSYPNEVQILRLVRLG
ncbi:MAG TPA: alpha-amylase family glycosyl hydrolase [Polyangiaceae bacterium]|nr:alpha-amylase family glycosyl hydrolase [Polyangiaceae bacterium]